MLKSPFYLFFICFCKILGKQITSFWLIPKYWLTQKPLSITLGNWFPRVLDQNFCVGSFYVLFCLIFYILHQNLVKICKQHGKRRFLPAFGVHITYLESKTFHSQPQHLECEAPKCCPKKPTPPPQLSDIIYGCSPYGQFINNVMQRGEWGKVFLTPGHEG